MDATKSRAANQLPRLPLAILEQAEKKIRRSCVIDRVGTEINKLSGAACIDTLVKVGIRF